MANIFRPSTWLRGPRSEPETSPSRGGHGSTAAAEEKGPVLAVELAANPPTAPREEVERRAHRRWCDAGCPAGRDHEFWLAAEREVLEELQKSRA